MRIIRFLVWAFVALCCMEAAAEYFGPGYALMVTRHTCLECRATRTTRRYVGVSFNEISLTDCSSYILSHNPNHQHQWRCCGTNHGYSLLSESRGCGGSHPIYQLSAGIQMKYAKLVSPEEYKNALDVIDSRDSEAARNMVLRIYEKVFDDGVAP